MADIYAFPQQEPQYYTRLSLRKYDRMPGTQPTMTLASAIRLPLPTALQDSFNIDVSNPSFELLGNSPTDVLTAGKGAAEEYQNMARQGNFSVTQAVQLAARAAALAPGISDTGVGKYAQSVTGMVRNPHLTTIFEGVRLKTYQFNWKLAPKSAEEARVLNRMFTHIKGYMHPKIIGGGFALEYPFIANVTFEGPPSAVMPNVKDSFITRMDINGAGSGIPAFYKDGQPVTVELQLAFQEINIQTRDDFISTGGMEGGPSLGGGVR
jgi:hypothetical protein